MNMPPAKISPSTIEAYSTSEIIEMALSDHISFAAITAQYGISADAVKLLMRRNLKAGSYRAWRKRVRQFGTRRQHYK